MQIRPLGKSSNEDDLRQVIRLQDEWLDSGLLPSNQFDKLSESFLNEDNTLVLEYDNQIVGYSVFFKNKRGDYEIDSLFLLEKYRKKGLGQRLLEQTESQIKKMGGSKITLCPVTNKYKSKLISFYEKSGYALTDEILQKDIASDTLSVPNADT